MQKCAILVGLDRKKTFNTYWPKILFTEKPFNECVSTNVLQLVNIHRNIKLPLGGVISHLDVLVYKGGLCPPNPPRLAAGYSPRCSLRSQTYGSAGGTPCTPQFYCEEL